jgi:hypothetical protein
MTNDSLGNAVFHIVCIEDASSLLLCCHLHAHLIEALGYNYVWTWTERKSKSAAKKLKYDATIC